MIICGSVSEPPFDDGIWNNLFRIEFQQWFEERYNVVKDGEFLLVDNEALPMKMMVVKKN